MMVRSASRKTSQKALQCQRAMPALAGYGCDLYFVGKLAGAQRPHRAAVDPDPGIVVGKMADILARQNKKRDTFHLCGGGRALFGKRDTARPRVKREAPVDIGAVFKTCRRDIRVRRIEKLMAAPAIKHERFGLQRKIVEHRDRLVVRQDAQMNSAVVDLLLDFRWRHHLNANMHIRRQGTQFAERAGKLKLLVKDHAVDDADIELAGHVMLNCRKLGPEVLKLRKNRHCGVKRPLAALGQRKAAPAALAQAKSEPAFKFRHVAADCRSADLQFRVGGGETAVANNAGKNLQQPQVDIRYLVQHGAVSRGRCRDFIICENAQASVHNMSFIACERHAKLAPVTNSTQKARMRDEHAPDSERLKPLESEVVPRYAEIATFMRLPHVPLGDTRGRVDIGLIGVPWDGGTTNRPGARHGPRQVREMSSLIRRYHHATGIMPFDLCQCADLGDAPVNPVDLMDALERVGRYYRDVAAAGIVPLTAGGDHLISLPILRSLGRDAPVGMIQIDAHTDTWDKYFGDSEYTHGTPFRRAIEEGILDPKRTVQIGIRGGLYGAGDKAWGLEQGIRVIEIEEFFDLGVDAVIAEARRVAGDGETYVSFDIDGLDPVFAPGTGTPEVGGLMTHDAQRLLRGFRGLNLVGADVVEVSPPFDPSGNTALVGATMMFEILCVLAEAVSARKCNRATN